jgi:hypothetical protein
VRAGKGRGPTIGDNDRAPEVVDVGSTSVASSENPIKARVDAAKIVPHRALTGSSRIGKRHRKDSNRARGRPSPVSAQLSGSDCAEALGVRISADTPIIALCRELIERGHDPATPLHAFRGSTLCVVVRSIGEAARLRVTTSPSGRPVFVAYAGAFPVHGNKRAAASLAGAALDRIKEGAA